VPSARAQPGTFEKAEIVYRDTVTALKLPYMDESEAEGNWTAREQATPKP